MRSLRSLHSSLLAASPISAAARATRRRVAHSASRQPAASSPCGASSLPPLPPPPRTAGAMTAASEGLAASPTAAPELPPITDRKLRILCLHGYLQNAEVFRSRIGSLRKALRSRAEFVFVDAPFLAEPADAAAVAESGGDAGAQGRSWWQWRDLEPGTRPSRAAQYQGWAASQAAIQAALQEHAPIDGLLGFSQGATAAAMFLAHARLPAEGDAAEQQQGPAAAAEELDMQQLRLDEQQQQKKQQQRHQQQQQQQQQADPGDQLRFAVIIAGFLPRDATYAAALARGRPAVPSLHVYGAKDALVPEERTAGLWECFAEGSVETYRHPGAHMVPTCSGAFKQVLLDLLDDAKAGRLHHTHQHKHSQKQQQQHQQRAAAAADAGAAPGALVG